jgi:hypothetical protein
VTLAGVVEVVWIQILPDAAQDLDQLVVVEPLRRA